MLLRMYRTITVVPSGRQESSVVTGSLWYEVRLSDGRVWRRHVDQLFKRANPFHINEATSNGHGGTVATVPICLDCPLPTASKVSIHSGVPDAPAEDPEPLEPPPSSTPPGTPSAAQPSHTQPATAVASLCPQRHRRPPQRYQDYVT